jgi:hypothetical protein
VLRLDVAGRLVQGERYSPTPPSERGQWLLALVLCLVGVGVLVAVLSGAVGSSASGAAVADPPNVLVHAATPTAANVSQSALLIGRGTTAGPYAGAASRHGTARASSMTAGVDARDGSSRAVDSGATAETTKAGKTRAVPAVAGVVASPFSSQRSGPGVTALGQAEAPISAAWAAGFYPIYGEAQRVFGVDWLLLASIHKQESAFSTAPSTYEGLNFAGCCGGPMQFNVTNGPVSTWDLVRNAYRFGRRPAVYDHRTARHPSIYDDFDSIMAAAWLLSSDGARLALDDSAWWAAYDYYGHDAAGVEYADEVLARAIGWSQHGFCIDCGVEPTMVQAVYEAYGAPVMATYAHAAGAVRREHSRPMRRG